MISRNDPNTADTAPAAAPQRCAAGEHDHRDDRRRYLAGQLSRAALEGDPLMVLERWIEDARSAGSPEPTAMVLATADASGQPSARCVLLKHHDARGLCWYTDGDSAKGRQLGANPRAALLFYWPETERQIRFEGPVARLSAAESDAYFASRPLGSRQAAVASRQSQPIANRQALEQALQTVEAEHGNHPPRPARWGGYRLAPERIEFWQGRDNRLHDRFQLDRNAAGDWVATRLMP